MGAFGYRHPVIGPARWRIGPVLCGPMRHRCGGAGLAAGGSGLRGAVRARVEEGWFPAGAAGIGEAWRGEKEGRIPMTADKCSPAGACALAFVTAEVGAPAAEGGDVGEVV